jgi:hypothetical protein
MHMYICCISNIWVKNCYNNWNTALKNLIFNCKFWSEKGHRRTDCNMLYIVCDSWDKFLPVEGLR